MKYLCLMVLDESKYEALSGSELQAMDDAAVAFSDGLLESGHMITATALAPARSATTVRVRNGKTSISDGPFAETNEQVGGFFLIEARDLSEATTLASKMPCAYLGAIEIRPLRELTSSTNPGKRVWQT